MGLEVSANPMATISWKPSYLSLAATGELEARIEILMAGLRSCRLCPWACGVDRLHGEQGACRATAHGLVAAAVPHFGEEPVLVGKGGSGNIFFGHCNLRCVYCQNHQISQPGTDSESRPVSAGALARTMIALQDRGCSNINLVSPTHFVPQILAAMLLAARMGLRLPLVYNTNGYESVEVLRLLDGVVDIYLPDLKYGDKRIAQRYSGVKDYVRHARAALREMYHQTGDKLYLDEAGVACRALIVRHLVLPGDMAGTEACLRFLSEELSPRVSVSLMAQYYPAFRAYHHPPLDRPLNLAEYERALGLLERFGFENGWVQEIPSSDCYQPDFRNPRPFNDQRAVSLDDVIGQAENENRSEGPRTMVGF